MEDVPVIHDEDVAVTDVEDGRVMDRPRRLGAGGAVVCVVAGGGQSVVISVMAARALVSST
jgi:hypothetical protein